MEAEAVADFEDRRAPGSRASAWRDSRRHRRTARRCSGRRCRRTARRRRGSARDAFRRWCLAAPAPPAPRTCGSETAAARRRRRCHRGRARESRAASTQQRRIHVHRVDMPSHRRDQQVSQAESVTSCLRATSWQIPIPELIFRRAQHEIQQLAKRVFERLARPNGDRSELVAQEVDEHGAVLRRERHATGTGGRSDRRPCRPCSRSAAATIAVSSSVGRAAAESAWSARTPCRYALVAAVARVVVLVAVHHHVRLGHRRRVALLGGLGDVHPLREPLADARVGGGHRAIGRAEALHVGKQHVAKQVAALQERRRRDPGAAAGPARDVRRIEQRLAEARRSCGRSREWSAPRAAPASCRSRRRAAPGS